MNTRTQFRLGFFGACIFASTIMMVSIFFVPRWPTLRWIPLIALLALFGFGYWWFRRFRGRLPKPTKKQLSKAAKATKRLGLIYLIAPVLAYLLDGNELIHLPYGLGFLIPIFPLALAVHYLRLSARLAQQQGADEALSKG
jgi:uncharacterized iron-regulated membrane protein